MALSIPKLGLGNESLYFFVSLCLCGERDFQMKFSIFSELLISKDLEKK